MTRAVVPKPVLIGRAQAAGAGLEPATAGLEGRLRSDDFIDASPVLGLRKQ